MYRGDNPETIDWGFDVDTTFSIPIETVKSEPTLKGKVRNNSSIIRYIKYRGVRFLFAGELETAGWEWQLPLACIFTIERERNSSLAERG